MYRISVPDELYDVNIGFLVVITGQACTLRCKDCANFSPYAPKETLLYDMNGIIGNLETIAKHSHIHHVQLQGGEAFIHPDLIKLLEYIDSNRHIKYCTIATNGTVIPGKNITGVLSGNDKFRIRVSNYNANKNNREKLKNWLDINSIKNILYNFGAENGKWYDFGKAYAPTNDIEARYQNCAFKGCLTLEDGILSRCSRGVIASKIQGFEIDGRGYLEVHDSAGFKGKLLHYIENPCSMEACAWCKGTDSGEFIEAAV